MFVVQLSNTSWAKTSHWLVRSAIVLVGATGALGVAAQNTNSVSALGDVGPGFDITAVGLPVYAGTPGPINPATMSGSEAHYAAASGESLTLRSMVATWGDSNQAQSKSSFNWTTVAGTGVSGLSAGDPFTATLSFRIDGRTAAGFGLAFVPFVPAYALPPDFTLTSSATSRLRFDMYDLDSPSYEGGAPQARISYVSAANVEAGLYSASSSYPNGAEYTNVGHQVGLEYTDASGQQSPWSGNDIYSASVTTLIPLKEVYDVDTGVLSVSIDTKVGNHLYFEGELQANVDCFTYSPTGSSPSCAGLADYSHTFDAELSSSVDGIAFSDYTPGVFGPVFDPVPGSVPEPETYTLMLAALGLLAVMSRRRKQQAIV